jgi:hypothetical protein
MNKIIDMIIENDKTSCYFQFESNALKIIVFHNTSKRNSAKKCRENMYEAYYAM